LKAIKVDSEALAVDDSGSTLIILTLGNPHLLESTQTSQDTASNPYGILPFGRSNDLDLHGAGSLLGDLLGHAFPDLVEHGGATTEYYIAIEIFTDIDITLLDTLVRSQVDPISLLPNEGRLEQYFRATEPLRPQH
jgi:hypothetical protein